MGDKTTVQFSSPIVQLIGVGQIFSSRLFAARSLVVTFGGSAPQRALRRGRQGAQRGPPDGHRRGRVGSPGVFESKTEGKLWEFDDFLDFLEDSWRILMIFLMIQLRKSLSSLKAVIRRQ